MNPKTISEIISALNGASRVLITAHMDPDGDSIGTQLVLRDYLVGLGKTVQIYNHGTLPDKYSFLEGIDCIQTDVTKYDFDPELVVILEATTLDRTGKVKDLLKPGVPIINIDHHVGNPMYGDINLVDENASSVAEILFKILKNTDFKLTKPIAEKLFTAILTDTGRFHFSSTTPDCLRICAELVEAGVQTRELTDKIYFSNSLKQMQVVGEVISGLELTLDGQMAMLTLTQEMLGRYGLEFSDFEGIVEYSMRVKDVTVGALFRDFDEGVTKISLRSRNGLDVATLAGKLGGGGHFSAAGVSVRLTIPEAKKELIRLVQEALDEAV